MGNEATPTAPPLVLEYDEDGEQVFKVHDLVIAAISTPEVVAFDRYAVSVYYGPMGLFERQFPRHRRAVEWVQMMAPYLVALAQLPVETRPVGRVGRFEDRR